MIQQGWHEQYDRMQRSYDHFVALASGESFGDSDANRDALFHFFQDAYHLKDWLKNDPEVVGVDPEAAIKGSDILKLCADLCNGTKHRLLRRKAHTGDSKTRFNSQSVTVHVGSHIEHSWTIESRGNTYSAREVADRVIDEWDTWLRGQGLL